jgi:hypothetical protein
MGRDQRMIGNYSPNKLICLQNSLESEETGFVTLLKQVEFS